MTTKWTSPDPVTVDRQLLELFPQNPVFSEILHRRGFHTLSEAQAFLYPQYFPQSNPFDFPGMRDSVQIVLNVINQGGQIGICGDYDTDGLTATAILYEGLLNLTPHVHFQVPVRGKESHGISEETIKTFQNLGVQTLITCDTGVSEHASIQYARELGMDVIITDHHSLPDAPANANSIINSEMLPKTHPMHSLSGSGIAYKFIEAVYQATSIENKTTQFLDLAAIGIIGDQVPLIGEARFLTQSGIMTLQNTERFGLIEILKTANGSLSQINEKIISHVIGPRLNSLSRMVDGNAVIELLTTKDETRAQILAQLAEQANTNRKQMTDTLFMAAHHVIEQDRSLLDKPLIFLENNEWHYSVLGLVASQLAERYARPVVIISSFDDKIVRGSARSIPGIDITAVIAENAEKLDQYGGHAMAAGFSLKKEKLADFKRSLMVTVSQLADKSSSLGEQITIDALLPLWETTKPSFLEDRQHFRPFGPENPVINFMAEDVHFLDSVNFGRNMQHRRMNVTTRKLTRHSVIWWNGADQPVPPDQFDLVYQITNSKPSSQSDLQIILIAFRPHEKAPAALYSRTPNLEVIDWRDKTEIDQVIQQLSMQDNTKVFAEGTQHLAGDISINDRLDITTCDELILLTYPASYDILKELLKKASPKKVYVVGIPVEMDEKTHLMHAVTEDILGSFRKQHGRLNIQQLAAKTGQTEGSIRLAIDWLVDKTTLRYKGKNGSEIVLDRSGTPGANEQGILEDLERSLEETAAFKRHFQKTDIRNLFMNIEMENQENK